MQKDAIDKELFGRTIEVGFLSELLRIVNAADQLPAKTPTGDTREYAFSTYYKEAEGVSRSSDAAVYKKALDMLAEHREFLLKGIAAAVSNVAEASRCDMDFAKFCFGDIYRLHIYAIKGDVREILMFLADDVGMALRNIDASKLKGLMNELGFTGNGVMKKTPAEVAGIYATSTTTFNTYASMYDNAVLAKGKMRRITLNLLSNAEALIRKHLSYAVEEICRQAGGSTVGRTEHAGTGKR